MGLTCWNLHGRKRRKKKIAIMYEGTETTYMTNFNSCTLVPSRLNTKLRELAIQPSLCSWILDFLILLKRQVMRRPRTSASQTLNTELNSTLNSRKSLKNHQGPTHPNNQFVQTLLSGKHVTQHLDPDQQTTGQLFYQTTTL